MSLIFDKISHFMQVNERQTPNFCKKSKKRYEMFITNKQFYLSPLVFVCPETGNPPPMGRPKQTTPLPLNSALLSPFDKINTDKENKLIFQ